MAFTPRLSRPLANNKYYITKANGGYSNAIQGYPKDNQCDVLSNCVGYAYGRFNEIGKYGYCKYLAPVNAEKFIEYAGSCEIGDTPKLGAVMVWGQGTLKSNDGAGHVAIVEKVISETEVVTSESNYGDSRPFLTKTRKKGVNGRWGLSSKYQFKGFIYNPAVKDSESTITNDKVFKVGDSVKVVDGAKTYTGGKLAKFVYKTVFTIMQIKNDRVVIGLDGVVTAAVKISDIYLNS